MASLNACSSCLAAAWRSPHKLSNMEHRPLDARLRVCVVILHSAWDAQNNIVLPTV